MRTLLDRRSAILIALTVMAVACGDGGSGVAPAVEIAAPVALSADTPVGVTGGLVQGALSEIDPQIIAFKGIPYAAAPVGDLRWKPPTQVVAWDGVRDASAFGSRCVQGGQNATDQSEDCLFLNVFTTAVDGGRRPVMLWIHRGGYVEGSANEYNGIQLSIQGDVVVVAINYRLGAFGFLNLNALALNMRDLPTTEFGT